MTYLTRDLATETRREARGDGLPRRSDEDREAKAVRETKAERSRTDNATASRGYAFRIAEAMTTGAVRAVAKEIKALRQRVAVLETREKAMRYRGVFQPAEDYEKGNFVTHDGSLWAAIADNPGKPGSGGGWQLCAKRGADGRDAR